MHGNHAIRNINNARAHEALTALAQKAEAARKQNHPNAAEFQSRHDKLKAELDNDVH